MFVLFSVKIVWFFLMIYETLWFNLCHPYSSTAVVLFNTWIVRNNEAICLPRVISPKVNQITQVESELDFNIITLQFVNQYALGDSPFQNEIWNLFMKLDTQN